jgi:eukaryotic-like serine/threonine-protein kinase
MFKLLSFHSVTMIIISSLLSANCYTTMSQASALFDILSPTSNNNNNFIAYQDSTLGIKIDYPAGWTHELHAGSLVTFLASLESDSNTYPAGLGVKVQHMKSSKNISLNEITKVQIKNLTQDHPDFKLIESTDYKVGGNNAHKIVFTATDDKKNERKAMQIWTLRGDKAYLITYKAEPGKYSRYLPIIQKMVDSFQFTQ